MCINNRINDLYYYYYDDLLLFPYPYLVVFDLNMIIILNQFYPTDKNISILHMLFASIIIFIFTLSLYHCRHFDNFIWNHITYQSWVDGFKQLNNLLMIILDYIGLSIICIIVVIVIIIVTASSPFLSWLVSHNDFDDTASIETTFHHKKRQWTLLNRTSCVWLHFHFNWILYEFTQPNTCYYGLGARWRFIEFS